MNATVPSFLEQATELASKLSIAGVFSYEDAMVVAGISAKGESPVFIQRVAEQLWHRAHAARTKRENEKHEAADFPDVSVPMPAIERVRRIAAAKVANPGLALDPATYAWVQSHRTLVAALMAGEAVVVVK